MNNPWQALPEQAPYVLPDDHAVIETYNVSAKPENHIELSILPEPFLGQADTPVVLLNLNPGLSDNDIEQHQQPIFHKLSRQNLSHDTETGYPFYLLNPAISAAPGYQWWYKRLRRLINICGHEKVAKRVLCVELFPYHSKKYKEISVPSQQYSLHLVRQAMERNAIIVQMRSKRLWFEQIPQLETYSNWFALRSVQAVYVTRKNCPDGFDKIVAAIQA